MSNAGIPSHLHMRMNQPSCYIRTGMPSQASTRITLNLYSSIIECRQCFSRPGSTSVNLAIAVTSSQLYTSMHIMLPIHVLMQVHLSIYNATLLSPSSLSAFARNSSIVLNFRPLKYLSCCLFNFSRGKKPAPEMLQISYCAAMTSS